MRASAILADFSDLCHQCLKKFNLDVGGMAAGNVFITDKSVRLSMKKKEIRIADIGTVLFIFFYFQI